MAQIWSRLRRFVAHRWVDVRDAQRALPPSALERLERRIAASEQRHTGEVCICVEAGLPTSYLLRDASPRERAVAMFGKLRMWDTEHNNGVLVYLLLAEHAIELVADRGLNRHVDAQRWQAVVAQLGEALRQGQIEDGLTTALEEVSAVLVAHFPQPSGVPRANSLPNHIELR
ncbi:TPM domain-containing protein [Pseudorhodoferax sp.]|uniref:TPM domain-containing protein n=1 Tax=Pseudorhodoferax sp. TaxID=1993553 RepID=UPI002DD63C9F|nr:TPM domain-containing protein [Pseudorhodoferax sp.]